MEDPSQYMVDKIQNYCLATASNRNATSLIKVHNCKLLQTGDISFPLNPEIWENYFKISINDDREKNILYSNTCKEEEKAIQKLKECSQGWTYPLAEVKLQKDRCALFLNRQKCITLLLNQVLETNNFGFQLKDPTKRFMLFDVQRTNPEGLSEYRARLVCKTLRKLLMYSKWSEVADGSGKNIKVVSVVTKVPKTDSDVIAIRCGTVLDPQDGKLARVTPSEYMSLRSTDMRLMAMHKYGIRVKDDAKFCELFRRLGEAAVTVDLLEVKPSSPVNMIRSGQGSTKGASFILYNSARLETLLRTFEQKVSEGIYEKLPPLKEVDLSLLSNEEEWELIFGYIFGFPNLINRCIENFDSGVCSIHCLIKYLDGLVSIFSVYYRRVRILTETRTHLMPHVYARIYLLKAVRVVFNMALELLDIEPVEFM